MLWILNLIEENHWIWTPYVFLAEVCAWSQVFFFFYFSCQSGLVLRKKGQQRAVPLAVQYRWKINYRERKKRRWSRLRSKSIVVVVNGKVNTSPLDPEIASTPKSCLFPHLWLTHLVSKMFTAVVYKIAFPAAVPLHEYVLKSLGKLCLSNSSDPHKYNIWRKRKRKIQRPFFLSRSKKWPFFRGRSKRADKVFTSSPWKSKRELSL